jgi:peptidylprolyl isomerase
LPQSRHRKTNKARKRPKAPYQGAKPKPVAASNNSTRIIAIVIVLALAASAVTYLIVSRAGKGSNEITTASGLKYTDEVVGTGATPQKGQMVSVNYTGTLLNGEKFDSSYDHGKPYEFRIGMGNVIKGWDEGLMSMKVGGKRHFVIPPSLGYKNVGQPPKIPANATLVFDVELLSVK